MVKIYIYKNLPPKFIARQPVIKQDIRSRPLGINDPAIKSWIKPVLIVATCRCA